MTAVRLAGIGDVRGTDRPLAIPYQPGLPADLKRAVENRARDGDTSVSEITREALRRFLDVA